MPRPRRMGSPSRCARRAEICFGCGRPAPPAAGPQGWPNLPSVPATRNGGGFRRSCDVGRHPSGGWGPTRSPIPARVGSHPLPHPGRGSRDLGRSLAGRWGPTRSPFLERVGSHPLPRPFRLSRDLRKSIFTHSSHVHPMPHLEPSTARAFARSRLRIRAVLKLSSFGDAYAGQLARAVGCSRERMGWILHGHLPQYRPGLSLIGMGYAEEGSSPNGRVYRITARGRRLARRLTRRRST